MKKHFFTALLFLMLLGCEDEQSGYAIKGRILMGGSPVEGADVSIQGTANMAAQTNASGYFNMQGAPAGSYRVKIHKDFFEDFPEAAPFLEKVIDIAVADNVVLKDIVLPSPVILPPATEVSGTSAKIAWPAADHQDFQRYELYRHTEPEFDQTTGTLVYSTSGINNTAFIDDLYSNTQYYYRLYVFYKPDMHGASNRIDVKTPELPLILNGSFEELNSNNIPEPWDISFFDHGPATNIAVDHTVFSDGNTSIRFSHITDGGCWDIFIKQTLNIGSLETSRTYRLSFRYRADFTRTSSLYPTFWKLDGNASMEYVDIIFSHFPTLNFEKDVWKDYEFEFSIGGDVSTNEVMFYLGFCVPVTGSWWVDDVRLEAL